MPGGVHIWLAGRAGLDETTSEALSQGKVCQDVALPVTEGCRRHKVIAMAVFTTALV